MININFNKSEFVKENKKIYTQKEILNGKITEFYDPNDLPKGEYNILKPPIKFYVYYHMNRKQGKGIYFYPNGKTQIKAFFDKDKKTGTWIFYNEKEEIIETIEFYDDQKNGNYKIYESGSLKEHLIYEKNTIKRRIK